MDQPFVTKDEDLSRSLQDERKATPKIREQHLILDILQFDKKINRKSPFGKMCEKRKKRKRGGRKRKTSERRNRLAKFVKLVPILSGFPSFKNNKSF